MRLWRLSIAAFAQSFDGGYGLRFDGRWNTRGHAVTYCATSPALCVLQKLVHIEDPALLPDLTLIAYDAPDDMAVESVQVEDMPADWRRHEAWTQARGDGWHRTRSTPLLRVPSAILPFADSPDRNLLINHSHPDAARIATASARPFTLDPRLL